MANKPMYPHVPKKKEPLFPHGTKGQQSADLFAVRFWDNTTKSARDRDEAVRLVKEELADWMQKGDGIIWVRVGEDDRLEPSLAIVVTEVGEDTDASAKIYYRGQSVEPGPSLLAMTGSVSPRREKIYQRGPDGYPLGADRILREAYGPMPDPDQPFYSGKGFINPVRIYGWQWSARFHHWRAFVLFPDGTETWTTPMKQARDSLDLMAKTEGDPISKYCCSICGDCAPENLLEEGRFLDRITWLREHYQEKHPGMWGGMSPMTIQVGEEIRPEHRHLMDMVDEPLPPEAF